jgi:hypothetical protein
MWLLTGKGNMQISGNGLIEEVPTLHQKESDDNLYHFTDDYNGLISIMNNKIKPQYCGEDFSYIQEELKIALPILCFCDIPIERHPSHLGKYGYYGIGFKKEWAKRNHLNPLCYIAPDSVMAAALRIFIKGYDFIKEYTEIASLFNENVENSINAIKNAGSIILMYLKLYEDKGLRYYDEKEWRYIYFDESKLDIPISVLINDKNNIDNIKKENQPKINKEDNAKLDFSVNDITHIFLSNEEEKDDFIGKLEGYSDTDIAKIRELIKISAESTQSKEAYIEKSEDEANSHNLLLEENRALRKKLEEKDDLIKEIVKAFNITGEVIKAFNSSNEKINMQYKEIKDEIKSIKNFPADEDSAASDAPTGTDT